MIFALAACSERVGERPLHYDLGSCGFVDIHEPQAGNHVQQGTAIAWSTDPPSSGPHYASWAKWYRSYAALDRGFWVHNLEHGGLVLLYRCDEGCEEDVAALAAAVHALPDDPVCNPAVRVRAILVSDPLLPTDRSFVTLAWGYTYTAACVDAEAIATFARDFYNRAPEDLCVDGMSLGGTPIP